MTPEQRRTAQSLGGRAGAYKRWAHTTDRAAALAPARDGFLARLERQVDPTGAMPSHERAAAAERLHREHMTRMAMRSAQVRAARKAAKQRGTSQAG